MPFAYVRDDARRRIKITLTDPIAVGDLIASVERQLADGAWEYGSLVDGRTLTSPATPTDVRQFATRVSELVAANGARGPVAFVSRKSGAIAGAQIYILLGGKTEFLEVFWDLDDAAAWLDERMARSRNVRGSA